MKTTLVIVVATVVAVVHSFGDVVPEIFYVIVAAYTAGATR